MRVSELSDRSGVPLSTIKFYIREGLLPRGESTASNQARYAKTHLERLALIRALREVCGLGIEAVGRVLTALDDPGTEEQPIRLALRAMEPDPPERGPEAQAEYESALAEVTAFLDGLAWTLPGQHQEHAERLADALVNLRRLVMPGIPVDVLAPYARAAWALSQVEYDSEPHGRRIRPRRGDDLAFPSRMAILGILLMEPVLLTLRRYALNARGMRHWDGLPLPEPEPIAD
jgi:DNA-binding transcriptional MerR regulator